MTLKDFRPVSIKDVMIDFDCSRATACRTIKEVKEKLGLPYYVKVTLFHFYLYNTGQRCVSNDYKKYYPSIQ